MSAFAGTSRIPRSSAQCSSPRVTGPRKTLRAHGGSRASRCERAVRAGVSKMYAAGSKRVRVLARGMHADARCMRGARKVYARRCTEAQQTHTWTARLSAMQDEMSQLLITREERRLKVSPASFLLLSDIRPEPGDATSDWLCSHVCI